MFEPHIFDWIKSNCEVLVFDGSYLTEKEAHVRISDLHGLISESSIKSTAEMLAILFPHRAKEISREKFAVAEKYYQVVRRRGIGALDQLQTYLGFGLSQDVISYETIAKIDGLMDDEKGILEFLNGWMARRELNGQPAIGKLLVELRYRLMEPSEIRVTQEFLNALFSIGEAVSGLEMRRSFFTRHPSETLLLLIADILKNSVSDKAQALIEALNSNRNVGYGLETFCYYGISLGDIPGPGDFIESPISLADWRKFRDVIRPLFEEDLASGSYLEYSRTWAAIRSYTFFFGKDRCRSWIVESAEKDSGFLIGVAKSLLTESVSSQGSEYKVESAPDTSVYDLGKLLPIARKARESFQGEDLRRVNAFISGAASWLNKSAEK